MTDVLVAYSSKHGSTAEIARSIADTLTAAGLKVDCREAGDVEDLGPYGAVVLGSAVYLKRWRREARRFLHRHGDELERRPFWIFSSGPFGEPQQEDISEWTEPRRIVAEAQQRGVRGHVVFGGRIPVDSGWHRSMRESTPPEYRDRRDWDEIRAWAADIAVELGAGVASRS